MGTSVSLPRSAILAVRLMRFGLSWSLGWAGIALSLVLFVIARRLLPLTGLPDTAELFLLVPFFALCLYVGLLCRTSRVPWRGLYHGLWKAQSAPFAAGLAFLAAWGALAGAAYAINACASSERCFARTAPGSVLFFAVPIGIGIMLLLAGRWSFDRSGRAPFGAHARGVVAGLRESSAKAAPIRGKPRRLLFSVLATLAALVFFVMLGSEALRPSAAVVVLIYAGLFLGAFALAYVAVAYFRPDARDIAPSTSHPVVLFLRPFNAKPARRLEAPAESALESRAPFVAIGEPSEIIPRIGAYRTFTSDDQWRGVVLDFMAASDAIVLVAGTTPGVLWELEQIQTQGKLARTIILFPAGDDEGTAATAAIMAARLGLGEGALALSERNARLVALAVPAPETFVVIRSPSLRPAAYELAVYVALKHMAEHGAAERGHT